MQRQFPCYTLVPQCSDKTRNEEWAKWVGNRRIHLLKVWARMAHTICMTNLPIQERQLANYAYDIDQDRVYMVGISMGGFGTWEFAARGPDLFAAAVPMAGFSDPTQLNKIDHIPF